MHLAIALPRPLRRYKGGKERVVNREGIKRWEGKDVKDYGGVRRGRRVRGMEGAKAGERV